MEFGRCTGTTNISVILPMAYTMYYSGAFAFLGNNSSNVSVSNISMETKTLTGFTTRNDGSITLSKVWITIGY